MGFLEIKGIRKSFGATEVLKGIDIEVEKGEFLVLLGPSGCGKSTLLNMIAGLDTVNAGEIRIAGKRVNELHPSKRDIAMVFQSYALYPNMTVAKNIAFGMEMRKVPKKERETAVRDVAKLLQIEPLLSRKPSQLSGGQRQRVAMGRALVRDPLIFLFDEPLSNLDAELRVQMRGEIRQMQRELGVTTVYVTHDQTEAMTMGDRVAVMNKGRIMQVGTPLELYHEPANRFVAGFIGSPKMNFLELRNGTCLGQAMPDTIAPAASDSCDIGLRPEHLDLIEEGTPEGHLVFEARVRHLEPLGHETLLHVETTPDDLPLTIRAEPERVADLVPGARLRAAMPFDKMIFFDQAEGGRIR